MRLSRRSFLLGGGVVTAAAFAGNAVLGRPQAFTDATALSIEAAPIDRFSVADPDRVRFGRLSFRSGLVLRSPAKEFGGFSSLWRSPDGNDLIALADNAQWLRARVEKADGRLRGLSQGVMTPLVLANGQSLRRTRFYDTESLAIAGRVAFVGVERHHAVMRFAFDGRGFSRGAPIALPDNVRELSANAGLEALAVAPAGSPLSGALVAVAERGPESGASRGYILTGRSRGKFTIVRSGDFDIADMAFLPGGDLLLLERRFGLLSGFAVRLRRIEGADIRVGRSLDGPVLYESEPDHQVDNMEGLAVHREGPDTVLSMVSDDNFNGIQRTLLLEFALAD